MSKQQTMNFNKFLTRNGFNNTRQRSLIAQHFFSMGKGHASAEDIYFQIVKKHPHIGRVTVYRTLKLLKDAGLASEYQFGENHYHYEPAGTVKHHDHLICTACGSIIEFKNSKIEKLQEEAAKNHHFEVQEHRLELFGRCKKCKGTA